MSPRCVRCGWPPSAHHYRDRSANDARPSICHHYEAPAPWWMRLLSWRPRLRQ